MPLLSPPADPAHLLYTEMVNAGAIIHGGTERHLRFNAEEHPCGLAAGRQRARQPGPGRTAGRQWGYDEINLNCGCPSDRVQRGAFGASLMKAPQLVADCVKAMRDVVDVPVTVKHRIGIDKGRATALVRDFVGTVADAGCTVFIVHARNAWLQGLEPEGKPRHSAPALRGGAPAEGRLSAVHLAINGGFTTDDGGAGTAAAPGRRDGGPRGVPQPWWLARWDALYYGEQGGGPAPDT